ncbi:MAG: sensor histidine kinase [Bryobacteraceae bacterium]
MRRSSFRRLAGAAFVFAAVPLVLLGALLAIAAVSNRPWIFLGAAVALIPLAWGILELRSYSRQVQRLRQAIDNLLGSPFADDLAGMNGELGSLARSLTRIAPQVRNLVEETRHEMGRREAMLASMVEGVFAVDAQRRVTFCNASFAKLIGVNRSAVEGIPILKLVRDPALLDLINQVLGSGQSAKANLKLAAAEGRLFEVQVATLANAPERGAIAILHDITEIERLERVRKDFVANVSHEFRTPLAAIRGYAETLLDGGLDDSANRRRFVEIIENHATRLSNIASDLLILSELDGGRQPAEPARFPVQAVLDTAVRTVEGQARARNIDLAFEQMDSFEIFGHRLRLEQALVNLLDNAIKFSHAGGRVRIAARLAGPEKGRIAISDSGIGIPSEDLPRIFERFYRVDKAHSRAVGGTGLGLSIVKHVVEQMNGSITVESDLGAGSCFTLVLPVVPAISSTQTGGEGL